MFNVGQEVEFHSFDGTWKRANIVEDLKDGRYLINDGEVEFARLSNVLRAIESESHTPKDVPVKYPLLRILKPNGTPTLTWHQLLHAYPLAASQPHLFLRGEYDVWSAINLYTNKTTPYIKMEYIGRDDSESMFLVFVIDEE